MVLLFHLCVDNYLEWNDVRDELIDKLFDLRVLNPIVRDGLDQHVEENAIDLLEVLMDLKAPISQSRQPSLNLEDDVINGHELGHIIVDILSKLFHVHPDTLA